VVDVGSSFLPSEITAAFLWAQLENLQAIQRKRGEIWNTYAKGLALLGSKGIDLPRSILLLLIITTSFLLY